MGNAVCRSILYQEIMNLDKAFFSIIIVCIDDSERSIDDILAAEDGMSGAEGFLTAFRYGKAFRKSIQLLVCVSDIGYFLDAVSNDFLEIFLQIFADDEDDAVETCL